MIKVTCDVQQTLPLSDMTEFQGELKSRTEGDYEQIQSSMGLRSRSSYGRATDATTSLTDMGGWARYSVF